MLDGIVESLTAAVTEPYLEPGAEPAHHCACEAYVDGPGHNHGHNHGTSYFTADHLAASVAAVQDAGFDAHFHAIGDAAVHGALDALAAAQDDAANTDTRHHIAHLQLVDPTDIPRFADLGVSANLQALWAHYDEQLVDLNLPVLGAGREGWLYPFGDLARAGASFAMGSDWPVSSPDPWEAIHVAVNRTHPDGARDVPLGTGQNLDVLTCLRAYTSGSAHLARTRTAGRMVVGAPADLALASSDPFELERTDPGALHNVTTTFTVAAGRIVHDRTESARPESAQEAL